MNAAHSNPMGSPPPCRQQKNWNRGCATTEDLGIRSFYRDRKAPMAKNRGGAVMLTTEKKTLRLRAG